MEKDLNQAVAQGSRFGAVLDGETTFGGSEVVVTMQKQQGRETGCFQYKLLATSRTSTMQKELTQEGENGFELVGMTVGNTRFGSKEMVSILKRPVR